MFQQQRVPEFRLKNVFSLTFRYTNATFAINVKNHGDVIEYQTYC